MAYTTSTKVQEYLNISSVESGPMTDSINAAEEVVNNYTGRNFEADSVASVRKFNGNNTKELPIDDCVEITKVERGLDYYGDDLEEITAGGFDGYYLHPINYSQEGVPIRYIHLRGRIWGEGFGNNQITAKWGYSVSPPADIVMATTMIAGMMYMANRGGSSGNVKTESIGNYSVTYKTEQEKADIVKARSILDSYKRYRL